MRIIALLSALVALTLTPCGAFAQEMEKAPNEGVTVAALGGVEGYTGRFAPLIDPGGSWGVLLDAQPTPVLGFEVQYSGASNALTTPAFSGGRLVRNGAGVNLKVGVPTKIEPYVYGGVGVSRANVNSVPTGSGFVDDTFGTVPVGGGVNFHTDGAFTAGVRGGVDFPFSNDYLPVNNNFTIWNGRVQVGGTF